jgi:hypothetical protein
MAQKLHAMKFVDSGGSAQGLCRHCAGEVSHALTIGAPRWRLVAIGENGLLGRRVPCWCVLGGTRRLQVHHKRGFLEQ